MKPDAHGDFLVSPITKEEEFTGSAEEWSQFEQDASNLTPFSSYIWTSCWWREYGRATLPSRPTLRNTLRRALLGSTRTLFVVLGRRASKIGWIAPFARLQYFRGFRIRCLEFLTGLAADCSDLLVNAEEAEQATDSLIRFLGENKGEWDCLDLRNIPEESPVPELLVTTARKAGLIARMHADAPHLVVPIEADWRTMLASRSKNVRQLFRNQMHRLERARAVIRVLPNPACEPGLVARMVRVESNKRAKDVPVLRLLVGHEGFYDALFTRLGPQQKMYAALLEIEGRLIAYEWGFRTNDSILLYNKAYLPDYGYYSPGTMLIPAVLEFGYQQGCRYYDFSRNAQEYKWRWKPLLRPTRRVQIWQPTLRSRFAAWLLLSVRPAAYRVLSMLRIRYTPEWDL